MTIVELAIRMIELGARIFPLKPGTKIPMTSNGFKNADNDVGMARTFLEQKGHPNYGMVWPQEANPVFSWDVDGGDGHTAWRSDWKALNERNGKLPPTLTTITPSAGRHLFLRWRTDLYGPPPKGDHLLGFTVRWPDKGYVVGPGSTVEGKVYESNLEPIADFPEAWARAALAIKVTEGERYAAIRTFQAKYYNRGLDREQIWTLLQTELAPTFLPALSDQELEERFNRAWKDIDIRLGEPRLPGRLDQVPQSTTNFDDHILDELELGAFPAEPDPAAFGGYLGAAVEDLMQVSTASPVGLLAALTTITGAVLATRTEYYGEQTSSFLTMLVGESGTGRKGTAMNAAWRALMDIWGEEHAGIRLGGLGSGEAIVGHMTREAEKGFARGLVWAPEMSEVLVVGKREGSTLTTILRNAFDREPLMNITKGGTLIVPSSQYQLAALTGITPDELRTMLTTGSDMTNGFVGRWLAVPVRGRAERVNGRVVPALRPQLQTLFAAALEHNRKYRHQPILLEDDAVERLSDYSDYLASLPGVTGTLARRYATIAARVALVHSSVEGDDRIPLLHVERALALTEYSRTGIPWVFGMSAVAAGKASRAVQWLATDGELTRSELSMRMFSRRSDGRVDDVIETLTKSKLIEVRIGETTPKGGRPPKILRLTGLVSVPTRFTGGFFRDQPSTNGLADKYKNGHDAVAAGAVERERVLSLSDLSKPSFISSDTPTSDSATDANPLAVSNPAPPPWREPCRDYAEHQFSHVIRSGLAICTICSPEPVA